MTAVLFDLDGTLIDTAQDLAHALNLQLARYQKPPLPFDQIRPVASHGSKALLNLAFNTNGNGVEFQKLSEEYLSLYASVLDRKPLFLSGIEALLMTLSAEQIPWGIVTNKPRRFSLPLIKAVPFMGKSLFDHSACLVCGDDAPKPKPSPETLFMACEMMNIKPEATFYVGDAARDIEAGRAAGMKTVAALFGYLSEKDTPDTWGADFLINSPAELLSALKLT